MKIDVTPPLARITAGIAKYTAEFVEVTFVGAEVKFVGTVGAFSDANEFAQRKINNSCPHKVIRRMKDLQYARE